MLPTHQEVNDKLTLVNVITWLEKQDPTTPYNFFDNRDCLLARYLAAQGYHTIWVGGFSLRVATVEVHIPKELLPVNWPHGTYGDALNSARKELNKVEG